MKTVWVVTVDGEIVGAGSTLRPLLDELASRFPDEEVTIGSGNVYLNNKKTNIYIRQVFLDSPEVWYMGNIKVKN